LAAFLASASALSFSLTAAAVCSAMPGMSVT
jgi:hypothetical protein